MSGASSGAPRVLAELGFSPGPRPGVYRGPGVALREDGGWPVLAAPAAAARPQDLLVGQLGGPGLWKTVPRRSPKGAARNGAPVAAERVFQLPPGLLPLVQNEPPAETWDADLVRDVLTWALATAGGRAPSGWTAPPPAALWDLLAGRGEDGGPRAAPALTVSAGPCARQASLVREDARLALVCPVVSAIPEGLSPPRRAALEGLLLDAHRRWPLVRVGLATDSSGATGSGGAGGEARAEVDLTGAPLAALERLLAAAADALRWVVAWIVRSAELVIDTARTLRAVDGLTLQPARA